MRAGASTVRERRAAPVLAAVVVHWGSEAELDELLAGWPPDERFELLVVDNGPAAEHPDGAGRPGPEQGGARWLRPGTNLGFGGGANAGLAATRAPLVVVLNPDARPHPAALDELVRGFEQYPDAAGLVPRLIGEQGEEQCAWQLRPLPKPSQLLAQTLFFPGVAGPQRPPAAGTAVEQPAAAALALRREAIETLGGFDAGFYPAWFEDVDLAHRARARGLCFRYWPRARFVHGLGASLERLGYPAFLFVYYRNLVRYLRKHHGAGWAAAARLLLPVGMLLRGLALPLRRPRRAASRRQAAAGLLAVSLGALTHFRRPRALARRVVRPEAE